MWAFKLFTTCLITVTTNLQVLICFPISRQLSSNILIHVIFKSSVIPRKHITYTFVHKHYIFLIKMYRWGIVLVEGLKFFNELRAIR